MPENNAPSASHGHRLTGSLARSVLDARNIVDELASPGIAVSTSQGIALSIGGSTHGPNDPVGQLLLNVLSMVAEFEADLIRARTREGMAVAKAKGRLKGKKPKLSRRQAAHLLDLHQAGQHTIAELAELFGVGRATVYREIERVPATV